MIYDTTRHDTTRGTTILMEDVLTESVDSIWQDWLTYLRYLIAWRGLLGVWKDTPYGKFGQGEQATVFS